MKRIYHLILCLITVFASAQNNPPTIESRPSLVTLNSIPQSLDVNEFNVYTDDSDGDNVTLSSSVSQFDCSNVSFLQNSVRYGQSASNTLGAGNVQTFKSPNNGFMTKLEVEFRGSTTSTTQAVIEVYQNNNADPSLATDVELLGTITLSIPMQYDALGEGTFDKPVYLEENRMYAFRQISGQPIRMRQTSFYSPGRTFSHDFNNPLVVTESSGNNNAWRFYVTQYDTNGFTPVSIPVTASDGSESINASLDVYHLSKINPTAIAQDFTVNLDAGGSATITPQHIDNGSTATCGGTLDLSLDTSTFDCSSIGNNTVTLTVTDASGNESSATATVTVLDPIAPILTELGDIVVSTTGTSEVVNFTLPAITDNCIGNSMAPENYPATPAGFLKMGVFEGHTYFISNSEDTYANFLTTISSINGAYPVSISSAAENDFIANFLMDSGQLNAMIGINDIETEGTFVWQNGEVVTYTNWNDGEPNNSGGSEDVVEIYNNGGWNDIGNSNNDRPIIIEFSYGIEQITGLPSGSEFPVGTTTNTFEASDASGNSATTNFDITVNDIPQVITQNIDVTLDESGNATITPEDIDKGSTSVSGIASLSLDQTSFDCDDIVVPSSSTSLNFRGDGHIGIEGASPLDFGGGNGFTFETQIYPRSNASSYVLSKALGGSSWPGKLATQVFITPDNQLNFGIDEFSGGGWTYISSPPNTISLNEWQHIALSYNPSTSTMKIYIEGIEVASTTLNTSNPDASPGLLRIGASLNGSNQFDGYMDNFRTWENALDPTEILAVKNNSISSVDNQLLLHYNFNTNSGTESIDLSATQRNGTFVGNLDESNWYSGADNLNPDGVAVTLTVTSNSGETATGNAIVNVQDISAPTVVTQDITVNLGEDGTVNIDALEVDNGSVDNCSITSYALDLASFDCSNLGSNTVTLTVTDTSGNESSATAIVNVQDITAPVLEAKEITVNLEAGGTVSIEASDVLMSVNDNCSPAENITLSLNPNTFDSKGTFTVELTATDAENNSTTVPTTVTVGSTLGLDQISPSPAVKLYPNPASDKIWLEASNADIVEISIYNMVGKLVKTSKELSMRVGDLSNGVYFAKVEGDKGQTLKVLKFIKK